MSDLEFSISYTTRAPRGSETNGRQYYFVSRPEFEKMIREDEFLEHAEVFGNYYGTARRFLQRSRNKMVVTFCSTSTCRAPRRFKRNFPMRSAFSFCRPIAKHWKSACASEREDREEVIQRRLITAAEEIENYERYNYILVNDRLEDSIEILQSIVRAERLVALGRCVVG